MPDAEVTVAVLGTKMDNLTTQVEVLTSGVAANTEASNKRLRFLETEQAVQRMEIDTGADEIKTLRIQSNWKNFAAGMVGVVSSAIAAVIGSRQ